MFYEDAVDDYKKTHPDYGKVLYPTDNTDWYQPFSRTELRARLEDRYDSVLSVTDDEFKAGDDGDSTTWNYETHMPDEERTVAMTCRNRNLFYKVYSNPTYSYNKMTRKGEAISPCRDLESGKYVLTDASGTSYFGRMLRHGGYVGMIKSSEKIIWNLHVPSSSNDGGVLLQMAQEGNHKFDRTRYFLGMGTNPRAYNTYPAVVNTASNAQEYQMFCHKGSNNNQRRRRAVYLKGYGKYNSVWVKAQGYEGYEEAEAAEFEEELYTTSIPLYLTRV